MSVVAVIPVKEVSERVTSKNFKQFSDGLSLLELKIRHVIDSGAFDSVYISSDSEKAEHLAEKYGIQFLARDVAFCNNVTPWSEVIYHVVSSIPVDETVDIAWCHTTSPLFTDYDLAIQKYRSLDRKQHNGLVTVSKLIEFIVSERARPVNYHWGVWHEYSQNLDKLYAITGALFVAAKADMLQNRYVVSSRPYLYEVNSYSAIDIDSPYDFKLAQLMYENRSRLMEG